MFNFIFPHLFIFSFIYLYPHLFIYICFMYTFIYIFISTFLCPYGMLNVSQTSRKSVIPGCFSVE